MNVPNYYRLLNEAKDKKIAYVGPFYGEFGHLLIHVLPFLGYLHKNGVKIRFCGHQNQQDLLVDDECNPIYDEYFELPAHFHKSVPEMNDYRFVNDENVLNLAEKWKKTAENSGLPFFDLSDPQIYRFSWWPWWYNNKFGHLYNLKHAYNPENIEEKAVTLYSRTKPLGTAQGTGEPFDIDKIISTIQDIVDHIYVVGHPDQSHEVNSNEKVVNLVTTDNASILKTASKSKVIMAHNSGAAYIARILRLPGIIFHNGDIERFEWTEYCSGRWSKSPLLRAKDYDEIRNLLDEVINE